MNKEVFYNPGDFLSVTKNDGKKFECIVVESYGNRAFLSKVLKKDKGVGTATWRRYGLIEDGRIQMIKDCKEIIKLSESKKSNSKGSISLGESVQKNEMTYHRTDLGAGKFITLCLCENYGGWSFNSNETESFNESYLNSKLSRINNK